MNKAINTALSCTAAGGLISSAPLWQRNWVVGGNQLCSDVFPAQGTKAFEWLGWGLFIFKASNCQGWVFVRCASACLGVGNKICLSLEWNQSEHHVDEQPYFGSRL